MVSQRLLLSPPTPPIYLQKAVNMKQILSKRKGKNNTTKIWVTKICEHFNKDIEETYIIELRI